MSSSVNHIFLQDLAVVLGAAALTTVVFQRLRQPVVLGYLLAGLLVGSRVTPQLVTDLGTVHTLSELGVILLMFSIGLEFSLRTLVRVGTSAGLVAAIEVSLMIWLGYSTAQLLGWGTLASLYAGGVVAISSTMIIAKSFEAHPVDGRLNQLVIGVLIMEDLLAILLLAVFTALTAGAGLSADTLAVTAGRLVTFLAASVVIGLLVVPRTVRAIVRLRRPETTLVAAIGFCFLMAVLAQKLGFSVAMGAFIAGALVAESGEAKVIEPLVQPIRDMFAAIFFVSIGMLIDPEVIAKHWPAALAFAAVVVLGKALGVSMAAFLTGHGTHTSLRAGLSMAQIGEFAFIIAGLGLSSGATGGELFPIAVAVSALTSFTTPWLIQCSTPLALTLERKLPRPLQTFASLYESWIERLRAARLRPGRGSTVRRRIRRLIVDAVCLAGITIGASVFLDPILRFVERTAPLHPAVALGLVLAGAAVLAAPFVIGILRGARRLGADLATTALPAAETGKLDLAAAPRRALVVALQLMILLAVGIPLLALTQPFLPPLRGALVLGVLLLVVGVAFWRSATNLQGHVRAGTEMVMEVLARQSQQADPSALAQVERMLPGLGSMTELRLASGSSAIGKSLAELNLRGHTGATVVALARAGGEVAVPAAHDVLHEGDLLALAGSQDAIAAARRLLEPSPEL